MFYYTYREKTESAIVEAHSEESTVEPGGSMVNTLIYASMGFSCVDLFVLEHIF